MRVLSPLALPLRCPRVCPWRSSDRFHEALDQLIVVVSHVNSVRIPCTRVEDTINKLIILSLNSNDPESPSKII